MVKFKDILNSIKKDISQIRDVQKTILAKLKERTIAKPIHLEIDLPDHLRQTYFALKNLGGVANAGDVSKLTGRTRANESLHLNGLVRNGILKKERVHKFFQFSIREEEK